jgi:heme/copper-type cytochrome/quinol oxidase subunit 2
MYKKAYFWLLVFASWFIGLSARAQDPAGRKPAEMADGLRANGKIYVVIIVVVTILVGLFAYVIRLDRKISRLEKSVK